MKILFTGASSFTGFWFVKTLAAAGHEIVCPLTQPLEHYTGIRRARLEELLTISRLEPAGKFGTESFLKLADSEPFDQLCHHAADVTNYKSPDFDAAAAVENNSHNLPTVLAHLQARGLRSVVLTGTYFEANEGVGSQPVRTFSPYSYSKTLTYDRFVAACHAAQVPLGKFVVPNPFGPWEEPRFTAFLMNNWKGGQPCEVKTPDYIRDNVHVDLLAATYAQFSAHVATSHHALTKCNPSGYAETQREFALRVAREVKARLGWACELQFAKQTDFSEPLARTNTEPAEKMIPQWQAKQAWDAFAEFYAR